MIAQWDVSIVTDGLGSGLVDWVKESFRSKGSCQISQFINESLTAIFRLTLFAFVFFDRFPAVF